MLKSKSLLFSSLFSRGVGSVNLRNFIQFHTTEWLPNSSASVTTQALKDTHQHSAQISRTLAERWTSRRGCAIMYSTVHERPTDRPTRLKRSYSLRKIRHLNLFCNDKTCKMKWFRSEIKQALHRVSYSKRKQTVEQERTVYFLMLFCFPTMK